MVLEEDNNEDDREAQDEALVALIEHQAREVEFLKKRISYYTSQLEESAKKLGKIKWMLACLRGHCKGAGASSSAESSVVNGAKRIKAKARSPAKDDCEVVAASTLRGQEPSQ